MISNFYNRGGIFEATASFKLDNFATSFNGIKVIVDTGFSMSTIPVRKLKVSETLCLKKKIADINANVPYVLSYGVETGGLRHMKPKTFNEKVQCDAMKFTHNIQDLTIANVKIPVSDIYLNYNRSGNVLIGLDIIEKLDSHIGKSKATGKIVMIACPSENMTDSYNQALKDHFGLVRV